METVINHGSLRPDVDPGEVDFSEAQGKAFVCLPGCGYCCLCSPEVERAELNTFLMDAALKPALLSADGGHRLRLQADGGACRFLKDRSCTIYEKRPRYCSSFPFHIHCGTRAQVNVDLSCRGLGSLRGPAPSVQLDGVTRDLPTDSALPYAKDVVARAPVEDTLRRSRAAYAKFETQARDAGSWRSQEEMTSLLHGVPGLLFDLGTLGKAARAIDADRVAPPYVDAIRQSDTGDLPGFVDDTVRSVFEAEDVGDLPVYIDRALDWHIFRIDGSELIENRLEEDGVKEETARLPLDAVGLRSLDPAARSTLSDYLRLVVSRDIFTGYSYFMVREFDHAIDAGQAGLEEAVTLAADLWWRSSLIAHLAGRETVSAEDAWDAVVFMDMDFLDSQTIGAVI